MSSPKVLSVAGGTGSSGHAAAGGVASSVATSATRSRRMVLPAQPDGDRLQLAEGIERGLLRRLHPVRRVSAAGRKRQENFAAPSDALSERCAQVRQIIPTGEFWGGELPRGLGGIRSTAGPRPVLG